MARKARTIPVKTDHLPRTPHPSWRRYDDDTPALPIRKPSADEFWARVGI